MSIQTKSLVDTLIQSTRAVKLLNSCYDNAVNNLYLDGLLIIQAMRQNVKIENGNATLSIHRKTNLEEKSLRRAVKVAKILFSGKKSERNRILTLGDRISCNLRPLGFRPIWPSSKRRRTMKLTGSRALNLSYTMPQKHLDSHTGEWFFAGKKLKISNSISNMVQFSIHFTADNQCLKRRTAYFKASWKTFQSRTVAKAANLSQNACFLNL